jgi:hypothetical protein
VLLPPTTSWANGRIIISLYHQESQAHRICLTSDAVNIVASCNARRGAVLDDLAVGFQPVKNVASLAQ